MIKTNLLYSTVPTDVKNSNLRVDVEENVGGRFQRHGQDDRRGRQKGQGVKGQVCLLTGVHHERLPQSTHALQHHQDRQQPRCQRLRGCHAIRVRSQVSLLLSADFNFVFVQFKRIFSSVSLESWITFDGFLVHGILKKNEILISKHFRISFLMSNALF